MLYALNMAGAQWRRLHGARAPLPLLQMAGHGGHREWENSKQETDQTVLTSDHHESAHQND